MVLKEWPEKIRCWGLVPGVREWKPTVGWGLDWLALQEICWRFFAKARVTLQDLSKERRPKL